MTFPKTVLPDRDRPDPASHDTAIPFGPMLVSTLAGAGKLLPVLKLRFPVSGGTGPFGVICSAKDNMSSVIPEFNSSLTGIETVLPAWPDAGAVVMLPPE